MEETPDVDCNQVDIQQMEQSGLDVIEAVNDFVMNIDVTDVQFDLTKLYDNA